MWGDQYSSAGCGRGGVGPGSTHFPPQKVNFWIDSGDLYHIRVDCL